MSCFMYMSCPQTSSNEMFKAKRMGALSVCQLFIHITFNHMKSTSVTPAVDV